MVSITTLVPATAPLAGFGVFITVSKHVRRYAGVNTLGIP